MKSSMVLACALALPGIALASDHGPVFSYATPVNSQGEVSCDAGLFGRSGSRGSQLSTGTGCGYGITPHITANVFLPATFGSGSLPEVGSIQVADGLPERHGASSTRSRV